MKHATNFLLMLSLAGVACGDDDAPMDSGITFDGGADDATVAMDAGTADAGDDAGAMDAGTDAGAEMCTPSAPTCQDEQIAGLGLFEPVGTGDVTNTDMGDGLWETIVDASGGGRPATESYVYVRFTDSGLEKVEVGDVDAFESSDWDLALRRFVIRANSGVAGPSCVTVSLTPEGTELSALSAAADITAPFQTEAYYDDSCALVPDFSGIGGPGTRTSGYWRYTNCVTMLGTVYGVRTADGATYAFEVIHYYSPEVQAACNAGTFSTSMGTSGTVGIRWKRLAD